MFAHYFGATTSLSRIERSSELKQIVELMNRLRDKVNKLKLAADKEGAASVDYRKHRVLAALLAEIEAQFTIVNRLPGAVVTEAEILVLVQGITNSIARFRAAYNPILAWPRDQQREIADVSLSAGIYGASLVAAAALPLATVGTLIAFFYAAPWLCGKARETTGLNNHRTASIRLLEEWQTVLQALQVNLELRVLPANRISHSGSNVCPEEFICLVNQEIMNNPYICMLDGITYEHDVILRCLRERGRSPHNNNELEGRSPESVLVLNRNLKDLIDKFKQEHPDFKYAGDEDNEEDRPSPAAAARM